jgi:transposase
VEAEHRIAADRSGLRYPSDLTGAEWAVVEPMVPPAKPGGRKRTIDVRGDFERNFLRAVDRLPMAGAAQRPAAEEHIRIARELFA